MLYLPHAVPVYLHALTAAERTIGLSFFEKNSRFLRFMPS